MLPMLLVLVADTGEGGSPSPFSVNYGLFFWTIIVFVLLMILLKKFAYPAILKATEEREATIARQLGEAEAANSEARTLLEENRRLLAEAKAATEKERSAAIERTRHEQEEILARARRDIAEEKDKALSQLRREAVDLSLAAAAKLIGQRLDAAADRTVVEGYLASLEKTS
jgi:F-type H+-transporting ATPase subunit b